MRLWLCRGKYSKYVVICLNETKLWKRYIVQVYDDKWLLESCPYDSLNEIDLDHYLNQWHTEN